MDKTRLTLRALRALRRTWADCRLSASTEHLSKSAFEGLLKAALEGPGQSPGAPCSRWRESGYGRFGFLGKERTTSPAFERLEELGDAPGTDRFCIFLYFILHIIAY